MTALGTRYGVVERPAVRAPGKMTEDWRRIRGTLRSLRSSRGEFRASVPQRSRQVHLLLLIVVAGSVPGTVAVSGLGSGSVNALLWISYVLAGGALLLTTRGSQRPYTGIALYGIFLFLALLSIPQAPSFAFAVQTFLQLTVPAIVYVLVWRTPSIDRLLTGSWLLALAGIVAAVLLLTAFSTGPAYTVATRALSIAVVPLFLLGSMFLESRLLVALLAAAAIVAEVTSGARTASLVLVLVVAFSPGLRLKPWGRILVVALLVTLTLLYAQTSTFKKRFFFSQTATLSDLWKDPQIVNTSGRLTLWPELIHTCSRHSMFGNGVGSSNGLAFDLSGGLFPQPHNEYIRIYCDTGKTGSVPLWAFFIVASGRSFLLARSDRDYRRLHQSAGIGMVAFMTLALTDNPLVYTSIFMAPSMLLLGMSHAAGQGKAAARFSRGGGSGSVAELPAPLALSASSPRLTPTELPASLA